MPQELVTPAREGKFKFKWRQASSKQNLSRGHSVLNYKSVRQRIRFYSFSTIIVYLLHICYDTSVRAPNYQILFELGEKTRNSKGISSLYLSLYVHVQYDQHLPPKDFEETWEAPHLQDRVFLEVISSKARRDETILEIAFFLRKKYGKIQAPDGNWKLWVNLSAMLFRLKGDRLSWQERLGANGIDNVQYKQNMGPVPRPKSCKDGSRK